MKKEDAAKRVIPIAANPLFDPGKCLEIRANHLAKIAGSNRAPSGDTDGVAYKSYRSIKQPDSHATGVVAARGGQLFVFADADSHFAESDGVHVIRTPRHVGVLSPILHTIPVQLLAYHAALLKGTDVDKPRNLAKSVTVE
jgi:hypothetical protein